MKTLTIRNVPDSVHARLRKAAAEQGISMEEEARRRLARNEVRRVLRRVDAATFEDTLARLRAHFVGLEDRALVDEFLSEKRARARKELGK